MALGATWGDSFDPGDTYYGYSWDLGRNYFRTLVMFKPAPGKQGLELVPDMATDLGKSSDGGKTWTYTIQKGLKFEDGTPITSKDVAYARLAHVRPRRAQAGAELLRRPARPGPRATRARSRVPRTPTSPRRSRRPTTRRSSSTSRSRSLSSTTWPSCPRRRRSRRPRTPARSTRRTRSPRVRTCGTATSTSTRVARWCATPTGTPSTDPNRKALPDQIDVKLGLQADDLDNQIISGDQDVDIAGTGVQPAALPKVLQDEEPAGPGGQPGRRAALVHRRSSEP